MKCPVCNYKNDNNAVYCSSCGYDLSLTRSPVNWNSQGQNAQSQSYDTQEPHKPYDPYSTAAQENAGRSTCAILGFIISLIGLPSCLCTTLFGTPIVLFSLLIPVFAIIFSALGIKSKKKGFAVAGLIISILNLLAVIIVILALLVHSQDGTNTIGSGLAFLQMTMGWM